MKWLKKIVTGRNVLLLLVLWLGVSVSLFNFGPYPQLRAAGGGDLLEERFGYTERQAQTQLEVLGTEGRALYQRFQYLDLANAALMALALALLLSYVLQRLFPARPALQAVAGLPLLVGALELIENLLLLKLLAAFPAMMSGVVWSASWATRLKLAVALPMFPLIVVSVAALGVKRLRRS